MKSYGSGPKPRARNGEPGTGHAFSQNINWWEVIQQIEEEGHLGEWASPTELQGLDKLMSTYNIVRGNQHPDLRALAERGYRIKPATTNTKTVDGRRHGDLILYVTKGA